MMNVVDIIERYDVKRWIARACPKSAPGLARMLERSGDKGIVLVDGKVHSLVGFTEGEMAEIMSSPCEGGCLALPDGSLVKVTWKEE